MGEVVTVPGVTEEELRRAAMSKANEQFNRPPKLKAREFTLGDWISFVREEEGRILNETSAQRELDSLIADGVVARLEPGERRYDERSKRAVVAYWYVEGDDGTSGSTV